jgi:signal transduction histidine kinase
MIPSLRLRLMLWSALVLLGTVGGFAWFIHWSVARSLEAELDGELEISAAALDATLRLFWSKELNNPPRPGEDLASEGPPPFWPGGKGKDRPMPGFRPPPPMRMRPEVRARLLAELKLPPKSRISPDQFFAVWTQDGTLLKAEGLPEGTDCPDLEDGQPYFQKRMEYRELSILGPGRSVILVGTPMEPVGRRLWPLDRNLLLAGSGIIGLGLLGQWWISRQIFKPLKRIAETAAGLSAKSLEARIDPATVDVELRDLATVLNSSFSRLEESFKRQAAFTADASHELRTPLAVIRGQAELALSRPRENADYVKALQVCQGSAERMGDLVERLLTLARADADFPGMESVPVDLAKLVSSVLTELPEGGTVDREIRPAQVVGDPVLLRQLAQNLVANALKHGGKSVRVSLRSQEGKAILKVLDKGPGIAEKDLPRIFDRFYRVDKARARSERGAGGAGLGLSICREIVLRHGGSITCQSIVGHETLFRVELPCEKETSIPANGMGQTLENGGKARDKE